MGGASTYSTQFLSHSGPRGPQMMNPGGMVPSRPGLPPSAGGLYASHAAQAQKMAQHVGYPGGQQGLKRPYHSEVSEECLLMDVCSLEIQFYEFMTDYSVCMCPRFL